MIGAKEILAGAEKEEHEGGLSVQGFWNEWLWF